MTTNGQYPRALRDIERILLRGVLPPDRPGYGVYRERIGQMVVIGEGRRGPGNLVLGFPSDRPDLSSPLAQVVAYGGVETADGTFTVTVREMLAEQIDIELISDRGEPVPDRIDALRSWSYSAWHPGLPSPAAGAPVREVAIGGGVTLALSAREQRLWVHNAATGVVFLLPLTGFYTELMMQMNIRDPGIALVPRLLFGDLDRYTDADLREAFLAGNRIRRRVVVTSPEAPPRRASVRSFLRRLFSKDY